MDERDTAIIRELQADARLTNRRRVGRGVHALTAFQARPLSRDVIRSFEAVALQQPEVLSVFVIGGGDDSSSTSPSRPSWTCTHS